ncbi:hypothetical protein BLNAU_1068 [Blattamonas nauphoetae]|nr:hypothetical protein BLNAU_1068 [Blattamonas nauphoetae]
MISIPLANELNTARRPDLHHTLSMVTFSLTIFEGHSKVEMDEMGNPVIQTPALNADDASMSSLSLVIPTKSTPNVSFSPAKPATLQPTPNFSLFGTAQVQSKPRTDQHASSPSLITLSVNHQKSPANSRKTSPSLLQARKTPEREKRSGIFQAAGLMPFNPAAEWLPTASSTISLSGQPEGRGICSLHAIFATSFDREGTNLIANSLFGLMVKTKLEETCEYTDFQSKESSHVMKMEELIEHDDSAFDGSRLHRSSLPHIFNVWREWFAHDFNYILPIPNIEMDGLTTLQRILIFDALLIKITDKLVTTAINKVPLLGQHASIIELNSLTLVHPANDSIYHTLSFPIGKIILRESKKSTSEELLKNHVGRKNINRGWNLRSLKEAILKRGYGDMHSTISSKKQTAAKDTEARTLDALSHRDHLPNNDGVVPHDDPLHRPKGDEDEGRLSLRSTHHRVAQTYSSVFFLLTAAATLHASITLYLDTVLKQKKDVEMVLSPSRWMELVETQGSDSEASVRLHARLDLLQTADGLCQSHHLQQLALLRTRNAARPRTHSNHRASAVGCNYRTEFTFNMNATYHPFVLARLWKESALIIISTCLTENAFMPQMTHILSRPTNRVYCND